MIVDDEGNEVWTRPHDQHRSDRGKDHPLSRMFADGDFDVLKLTGAGSPESPFAHMVANWKVRRARHAGQNCLTGRPNHRCQ